MKKGLNHKKQEVTITQEKYYWVTSGGIEKDITQLTEDHFFNILKMIARRSCEKTLSKSDNILIKKPNLNPMRVTFQSNHRNDFVYEYKWSDKNCGRFFQNNIFDSTKELVTLKLHLYENFLDYLKNNYNPFFKFLMEMTKSNFSFNEQFSFYIEDYLLNYLRYLVIKKGLKYAVA